MLTKQLTIIIIITTIIIIPLFYYHYYLTHNQVSLRRVGTEWQRRPETQEEEEYKTGGEKEDLKME